MQTRAVVLDENSTEFELRTLTVDEPGAGQVHVKFVASGLRHSDLHSLDRIFKPRYPIVMGHERAGIVESVGTGVTSVKPGDHLVCSFIPSCASLDLKQAKKHFSDTANTTTGTTPWSKTTPAQQESVSVTAPPDKYREVTSTRKPD